MKPGQSIRLKYSTFRIDYDPMPAPNYPYKIVCQGSVRARRGTLEAAQSYCGALHPSAPWSAPY